MTRKIRLNFVILTLLAILSRFIASDNAPYDLFSQTAYIQQRTCVQWCLMNDSYDEQAKLAGYLGCKWDGAEYFSTCVCRTDLASSASYFLTSCVNSGCSGNTPDVTSAMSLYNSYCGLGSLAANVATTTEAGGATPTVFIVTTVVATGAAANSASTLITRESAFLMPLAALFTAFVNVGILLTG